MDALIDISEALNASIDWLLLNEKGDQTVPLQKSDVELKTVQVKSRDEIQSDLMIGMQYFMLWRNRCAIISGFFCIYGVHLLENAIF